MSGFMQPCWMSSPRRGEDRRIQQPEFAESQEQEQAQVLTDLQRTMDPLIAAQVYNSRFSPLLMLPWEILLLIVESATDDVPTLVCLRMTSRILFHLVSMPHIRNHIAYIESPFDFSIFHTGRLHFIPSEHIAAQLRPLLERDKSCDNCRCWNETHAHIRGNQSRCKFRPEDPDGFWPTSHDLYCDDCGIMHNPHQFSTFNQQETVKMRTCLGRQGSVKLCEHMHIAWAKIENHIRECQQRMPGNWKFCAESFNVECRHPTHDMRCTPEELPTWPRASLRIADLDPNRMVLNLEWTPHSGPDSLTVAPDGQLAVSELKTIFQKFQQGVGSHLFPSHRPGHFPELACFNQNAHKLQSVRYETGDDESSEPCRATTSAPQLPPRFSFDQALSCSNGYGNGENGHKIEIKIHYPPGTSGYSKPTCVAATYKCDILVCSILGYSNLLPTHDWLHAMDRKTYPQSQAPHVRPECKDETCNNYYARRKLSPSCCRSVDVWKRSRSWYFSCGLLIPATCTQDMFY